MLTCRELTELVTDFADRELQPARRRLVLAHLDTCGDCRAYVDSYRKTVALARAAFGRPDDLESGRAMPEVLIGSILAAGRRSSDHLWNLLAAVAASPLLFFYFGSR